jgi:hypothetical protein
MEPNEGYHKKTIPIKELKADEQDEIDAAKAYHEQGLHRIEEDEKEHLKILREIERKQSQPPKKMRIDGHDYWFAKTFQGSAQAHSVGVQWKHDGGVSRFRVVKGAPLKYGFYYHLYVSGE